MRAIHFKSLLLVSAFVCASAHAQVLFQDDFNGSLSAAWAITNPDTNYYSLNSSELVMRASQNDIDVGSPRNVKNLFLINNPATGDFAATLKIDSFAPTSVNFAQIDIVAMDDSNNLARCIYGYINSPALQFGKEVGGSWNPQSLDTLDLGGGGFYLRLSKTNTTYYQSYSFDGANYTQVNQPMTYGNGSPKFLGFCMGADPSESNYAYIDSFTVTGPLAAAIAPAVLISWPTLAGTNYQVQATTNLVTPNWTNVGPSITAANNLGTNEFDTAGNAVKYYRIVATP